MLLIIKLASKNKHRMHNIQISNLKPDYKLLKLTNLSTPQPQLSTIQSLNVSILPSLLLIFNSSILSGLSNRFCNYNACSKTIMYYICSEKRVLLSDTQTENANYWSNLM